MGCHHSCGKRKANTLNTINTVSPPIIHTVKTMKTINTVNPPINSIESRKSSVSVEEAIITRNRTPSFGLRPESPDHTYELPREELTGFSCPSGHPLLKTEENLYTNNQYTCRLCGQLKDAEADPSGHCANCKFDSCPHCLKMQPDSHYACSSGHRLFRVTSLEAFNREEGDGVNNYTCNLCGEDFDSTKDPTYHCSHCDFDICHYCFKEKQTRSYTCPIGHHLFVVKDLQQFHKGMGFWTNMYNCNICKRELDAKECPTSRCPACLFNVCADCVKKNRILVDHDGDVSNERTRVIGNLKVKTGDIDDSSRQI